MRSPQQWFSGTSSHLLLSCTSFAAGGYQLVPLIYPTLLFTIIPCTQTHRRHRVVVVVGDGSDVVSTRPHYSP